MTSLVLLWQPRDHWNHEFTVRNKTLRLLGFVSYAEYLASSYWRKRAKQIRVRDKNRCRVCRLRAADVHHLTYVRLGRELDVDLLLLCRECHTKVHARHPPSSATVTVIPPVDHTQPPRINQPKKVKKKKPARKEKPISSRTKFAACTSCQRVTAVREGLCLSCRT